LTLIENKALGTVIVASDQEGFITLISGNDGTAKTFGAHADET
jgi:hypothetical protein